MTILRGECGHIKLRWDNRNKCIKCSSCSRESTCSTCSTWTDETQKLAEKRRTYASRKWVMKAMSDSSDEENMHGITTPHGPAARGRTPRLQLQRYLYPEEYVHRPLAIHPLDKKTSQTGAGHRSVIRLYINLHLGILMPWAWSSLVIEQIWVLTLIQTRSSEPN